MKVKLFLKHCHLIKKARRLCIGLDALVCFMSDDIEYDTPDKTCYTFRQKSQLEKKEKKKMYTQAAHIISQQSLL